jgi:hypothetical protein
MKKGFKAFKDPSADSKKNPCVSIQIDILTRLGSLSHIKFE